MKLYIMRHGEASRGSEDSLRALTDLGQEQVRLISSFLNSKGNDIDVIWHSSYTRAKQTAKLLEEGLTLENILTEERAIEPEADVAYMQRMIETTQKNLFLVSHLPFVDRLVAQLLVSRDINIVHFRPATLVILDYIGDRWYLAACIYPELLMEKE